MKFITGLLLFLYLNISLLASDQSIFVLDLKNNKTISLETFGRDIEIGHIVLGEMHNEVKVLKAQKKIISAVLDSKKTNQFTLSWEFLDYPDQQKVNKAVTLFQDNKIKINEFMNQIRPNGNIYYAYPLSELERGGNLIGINAPRAWKRLITKNGLANLDPQYLPPNMELGGENYFERFVEAMGGHMGNDKLFSYWEAQCYTDSVMAYQAETHSEPLNFIINGSFHSDYNDGMVAQLAKITARPITTVKIVTGSLATKDSLKYFVNEHPKYGYVADYLVIAQ